jgi:hypothetical protein
MSDDRYKAAQRHVNAEVLGYVWEVAKFCAICYVYFYVLQLVD